MEGITDRGAVVDRLPGRKTRDADHREMAVLTGKIALHPSFLKRLRKTDDSLQVIHFFRPASFQ